MLQGGPIFGRRPLAEALAVWGLVLLFLVAFRVLVGSWIPYGSEITAALAVGLFIWAPDVADRRAGRPPSDHGLRLSDWKHDVVFALAVMLVVFPAFTGGFFAFLHAVDHWFPRAWAEVLTPYEYGGRSLIESFRWRAPPSLLNLVAGNIAVAVAEELFYRGWMLARLEERWPPRRRLLGAPFGLAMLVQAALFAAGHLLTPQPFRLATFFPGLLFGWMAARTGRVLAPAIVHAGSNVFIATLEASAFP